MVPIGKVVTVELHNQPRSASCQRQIRVVYSLKNAEGNFLIGGAFSQVLSDVEMQGLS
jgi:hypothetical protein